MSYKNVIFYKNIFYKDIRYFGIKKKFVFRKSNDDGRSLNVSIIMMTTVQSDDYRSVSQI